MVRRAKVKWRATLHPRVAPRPGAAPDLFEWEARCRGLSDPIETIKTEHRNLDPVLAAPYDAARGRLCPLPAGVPISSVARVKAST